MKKNNNKGFTLMEMLIVVAIIAVLVAIAIPVFTNQLEKAREATDAANIRSAYAEVMACALTDSSVAECKKNDVTKTEADGANMYQKYVAAVQTQKNWQNTSIEKIAGQDITQLTATKNGDPSGWTITYTEADGKVVIAAANK